MRYELYLDQSAGRFPDKTAVAVGDNSLTYAQWRDQANRLAASLVAHGVERGDRVVLFLDNSLEAAVGIFAALKAGAVFSVVNATTKQEKLAYILNNCRAAAIITQRRLLATATAAAGQAPSVKACYVADAAAGLPNGWLSYEDAVSGPDRAVGRPPGVALDLAMIIYTSGSTGAPKGVMMTHQNIDAASWSITTYVENTPDDVILSALPLSFDYGLYQLLMACRLGATLVLEKSFIYPNEVLQVLRRWRATGFPLVPTMAALLVQMRDFEPGSIPHLRYITNTAAALPPAHIQRLQDMFPTTRIFSMYGLTECKRCTYLPPEQLRLRPTSVGIAIPGTEAYVIDEAGRPTKPGEVGTLVVRGPHVMQGYWENPEETARKLKPGLHPWEKVLYTGDLFKTDDEGYLYFVGRSDDIIKTRGEKVSPKEVENVLYAIPGVTEAAVVGVPDAVLGEALKAVLVLAPGHEISARDVQAHCARHLESFMVPQHVEFRDALPKTDTGKIRRREVGAVE